MKTLVVEGLTFAYGDMPVLKDISFTLREGEILSVLGPNGAGKSTLFRCILRALRTYEGRILVNGEDTKNLTQRQMARRIAYIPQIHRPTFGYRVLDVVMMGMSAQMSPFSPPGREHEEKALAVLASLSAERFALRSFVSLSGGEQQMVLIARAIAQESDFLVMDEPTSALDYGNQLRVLAQIRKLAERDFGVLLSTHNPQHALSYADRILALREGTVAADGTPKEALTPELIRQLYGVGALFADTEGGRVIVPVEM